MTEGIRKVLWFNREPPPRVQTSLQEESLRHESGAVIHLKLGVASCTNHCHSQSKEPCLPAPAFVPHLPISRPVLCIPPGQLLISSGLSAALTQNRQKPWQWHLTLLCTESSQWVFYLHSTDWQWLSDSANQTAVFFAKFSSAAGIWGIWELKEADSEASGTEDTKKSK